MPSVSTTEPKITVILPVYNVAEFLPRCLRSLENQTFRDFCVIAVNDGSTDASAQILRDFAAAHPYFTVVEQENQGVSAARNAGIAMARSEYISFLDSDDFIAPTFLQELYDACEQNKADIACCFYYYYFPAQKLRVQHPFRCAGVYTRQQAMNKLLRDLQLQSYPWNKLYKRSLFTDYDVTYPPMRFEDVATTHKLFAHANRIAVINRPLYYYTQRKDSFLKTPTPQKINDFIRAAASVRVSLEADGQFEQYQKRFGDLCRKTAFYCDYYVVKYHMKNRSVKGMADHLRRVRVNLRYYQSDRFHPEKMADKCVSSLPDALPVPTLARK